MAERDECVYAKDDGVASRYLRGDLDSDAEAFEAHFFACERCWAEVEGGLQLRSALSAPRAAARPAARRRTVWLAVAASIAAATGLLLFSTEPRAPAFRQTTKAGFTLAVSADDHSFLVSWPMVEAGVYQVQVMDAEGKIAFERSVTSSPAKIPKAALPGPPLYVRVQALEGPGLAAVESAIRRLDEAR